MPSWQGTRMRPSQVSIARLVCEEGELAVVPGAEHVEVQAARTGQEVVLVAAHKSSVGTDVALEPGIPIA